MCIGLMQSINLEVNLKNLHEMDKISFNLATKLACGIVKIYHIRNYLTVNMLA